MSNFNLKLAVSHEDVKYVIYGFASIKSHFMSSTESFLLLCSAAHHSILKHNPIISGMVQGTNKYTHRLLCVTALL